MLSPAETIDIARAFMDKGGPALWAIFAVSLAMWAMILERYWYLYCTYPRQLTTIKREWQHYRRRPAKVAKRLRGRLLEQLSLSAGASLGGIRSASKVLPLLGLLGTVFGMIDTFDVITVFGNGNARGLAGGISEALLTTMAGLVTALSGLYFSSDLHERIRTLLDLAADELE